MAEKKNWTRYVPALALATMTALASLLASVASAAPPSDECVAARATPAVARLPEAWRAAVLDLIGSTAEPGHPWSCTGGTIDLKLNAKGAVIGIAREGEEAVWRQVASAEDVVPLGEALLAEPLPAPAKAAEQAGATAPSELPTLKPKRESPSGRDEVTPAAVPKQASSTSSNPSRRLLISAGIDGRGVGGSGVGWIGPTASAGLVLGRWLPSISLRQESAVFAHGPPINEVSVAVTVQSRFELFDRLRSPSPFWSCSRLRSGLPRRLSSVCASGTPRQQRAPPRQGPQCLGPQRSDPRAGTCAPHCPLHLRLPRRSCRRP